MVPTGYRGVVEHEQVQAGWSCLAMPVEADRPAQTILGIVDRTPRFRSTRLLAMADATTRQIDREWLDRIDSRSR